MPHMARAHTTMPISFSPLHNARIWSVLAVVFFSLAAVSYYWNEMAQYHTYLGIGLVMAVLGLLPLVVQAFQSKSK